jgi:thioredoxin reductase (NADPH)
VEVYHSFFKPLEWSINHEEHAGQPVREDNACFFKIVTRISEKEKILGLHCESLFFYSFVRLFFF